MFTITRNTTTGKQEVLTDKGFKTREWLENNRAEKLFYTKEEGSKKIRELRADCRLPQIKKSIILNYN